MIRLVAVLFLALSIFPISANGSIWSKKGTSFPAGCFDDDVSECRVRRIVSPDGKKFLRTSYEKVSIQNGGFFLTVKLTVDDGEGHSVAIQGPGSVEQEVLWSPDSKSMAITGSDGGEGLDSVAIYRVGDSSAIMLRVIEAQEDMLKSFPPCLAKNSDPHDCELLQNHPEDLNVSAIDWNADGTALVVMAEIVCSSRWGGIMC